MGFWDRHEEAAQQYDQVYQPQDNGESADFHNEPSTSHEIIGGAAAFAAMAMYEHKQKTEGKKVSHSLAKECIAGLAGFEADKLAESKGEDFFDREKAKHEAKERATEMYETRYGEGDGTYEYNGDNSYEGFENRPPPQMDERQQECFDQFHN